MNSIETSGEELILLALLHIKASHALIGCAPLAYMLIRNLLNGNASMVALLLHKPVRA
jgi:hypothetical protein